MGDGPPGVGAPETVSVGATETKPGDVFQVTVDGLDSITPNASYTLTVECNKVA